MCDFIFVSLSPLCLDIKGWVGRVRTLRSGKHVINVLATRDALTLPSYLYWFRVTVASMRSARSFSA